MQKKLIILLLTVSFFVCCITFNASAATVKNSDTTRVYKKVVTTTHLMNKLYSTVPLYAELGITETGVNEAIKKLIYDVLFIALSEKESGVLTEINISERFKDIVARSVQYMDSEYIALVLDSYSEETIENLLNGIIPDEFSELYSLLAQEAYYILGYHERGVDIIFDDMNGYEWSIPAVDYLFNEDIVNGIRDFDFNPGGDVTREQFVKMIYSAFKEEIHPGDAVKRFNDVSEDTWYFPYVTEMASAGLVNGISDVLFGTGMNIKRQDMAVLMFRIGEEMGYFSEEQLKLPFHDQNEISGYALTAINTLRNNGILNGDHLGNFNPHNGATRAEAAQMIYNFIRKASDLNQ